MMKAFEQQLRKALSLKDAPAMPVMPLDPAAALLPAAVLILAAPSVNGPSLLFLKRTETVEKHKGQIAFPGGRRESADEAAGGVDPDVATALRETREETGVAPDMVEVLGKLAAFPTITRYRVTPVAGISRIAVENIVLRPDPREVDGLFWVPVRELAKPETYRREYYTTGGSRYPTDVFMAGGRRIWGITGAILKNLLDRLAAGSSGEI